MNKDKFLQAINASYENQQYLLRKEQVEFGLKEILVHFVWLCILIFLSPHKSDRYRKIYMVYSERHIKALNCYDVKEVFSLGKCLSDMQSIRTQTSCFSPFGRLERVKILFKASVFFLKNRKKIETPYTYLLEYYSIDVFLDYEHPEVVYCAGHFDRYMTVLSYLLDYKEIKLIGSQHGILANVDIPNKIIFYRFDAYDEHEAKRAKKFIKNDDCIIRIKGFTSDLEWIHNKKQKVIVAVASQDRHVAVTKQLLKLMMQSLDLNKVEVIVYPHYREKSDEYRDLKQDYVDLKFLNKQRYSNIDILVTFYSTIVYDYFAINPSIKVVCFALPGFEVEYYERDNVHVYKNMQDFIEGLAEICDECSLMY